MDFIMDNYLWIGIIGVVLLMALIGFLAEKTNFITNSNAKPKKEKKSKWGKKESDESVVTDMSFTPESNEEIIDTPTIITDEVVEQFDNQPAEILEVVTGDNDEPTIESAPIADATWKTEEPIVAPVETPVVTDNGEDLTVPFGDDVKTIDDVETKKEDTTTVVDDDEDIWKF